MQLYGRISSILTQLRLGIKGAEIMNTYFLLFSWFDCNPQKSFNIFFHTCNMYSACVCVQPQNLFNKICRALFPRNLNEVPRNLSTIVWYMHKVVLDLYAEFELVHMHACNVVKHNNYYIH